MKRIFALMALAWVLCALNAAAKPQEIPEGFDAEEYDRLRARATAVDRAMARLEGLEEEEGDGGEEEAVSAGYQFSGAEGISIRSIDSLVLDDKTQVVYGRRRTRITAGERFSLEADRVTINIVSEEIEAEGDVLLTVNKSEIKATRLYYNFGSSEGVAYQSDGQYQHVYFRADPNEQDSDAPSFRQLNENQYLFQKSRFTTDDFPRPMYEIKAREAVLFPQDRIFMRNAVLYIREKPVMYFAMFNRSIEERQAWHFVFGNDNDLGGFVMGTYQWKYHSMEPSFEDEDELIFRSHGDVKYHLDYFGDRGVGYGMQHGYSLNYEKHAGDWELYRISDDDYNVRDDNEADRWIADWKHRSRITRRLWWRFNADWMSDPEIYYDIIDKKNRDDYERGRLAERRIRSSLDWVDDYYLLRALVERKERISRDRITDYAEPGDDDRDYDTDDELTLLQEGLWTDDNNLDDEGIDPDRYSAVSKRLPELTLSTSWLNIFRSPYYYNLNVRAFRNLDKGLNSGSREDDAWVEGYDVYNRLMFFHAFSDDTNLMMKLGAGFGQMDRERYTFDFDIDDREHAEDGIRENGSRLVFTDDDYETFLVGRDERSLSEVQSNFVYYDADTLLTHRFSRSLTGEAEHFIREGAEDSLSEWYESIGNHTARSDLYDYRLREHWIKATLNYRLRYPDLNVILAAERNLQSGSDITPNEIIQQLAGSIRYRSPREVFTIENRHTLSTIQYRAHNDEYMYEGDVYRTSLNLGLRPLHDNWWSNLGLAFSHDLDDDPLEEENRKLLEDQVDEDDTNDDDRYDEGDNRYYAYLEFTTRIGPKWALELRADYEFETSDLNHASLLFKRDLHDGVMNFELDLDDNYFDDRYDDNEDNGNNDKSLSDYLSYRIYFTFKLPDEDFLDSKPIEAALRGRRTVEEDS
ncbi:hypothetical protein JXA32_12270 [Candidatus Sumerlaeota bacterium]|nr:hypothetical protein [Candidatus Sumerlaeota bacterium]